MSLHVSEKKIFKELLIFYLEPCNLSKAPNGVPSAHASGLPLSIFHKKIYIRVQTLSLAFLWPSYSLDSAYCLIFLSLLNFENFWAIRNFCNFGGRKILKSNIWEKHFLSLCGKKIFLLIWS